MTLQRLLAACVVLFALVAGAQAQTSQTAPPSRTAPPAAAGPQSTQPSGALIDINSASKEQLDALKGIGPARADAIIKNRPYRAKTDLKTRNIIPESVYNDIQDKIVARQTSAGSSSSGATAGSGAAGSPTKK
jgi:DNA uptake protein ComE-like DNA-binding protein